MNKILLIILKLVLLYFTTTNCVCPIEKDPLNLARCIQLDIASILYAVKNSNDLSPVCLLADRYMECLKTYSRGCVGFNFGEGALTELQNIALYCCNGIATSTDCIFNPNVSHTCIDAEARVKMADNSHKQIKQLEIGDKVKTLNSLGQLIDTTVIMIMDTSDEKTLFVNIKTKSNHTLKVSSSHLVAIQNGEYKFANKLHIGDLILRYNSEQLEYDIIESLEYEKVNGFAAPLTLEGTILVEDILISCYALIESHYLAHLVMAPIRWLYTISDLYNDYIPDYFQMTKQLNGVHWYPGLLYSFVNHLNLIQYL